MVKPINVANGSVRLYSAITHQKIALTIARIYAIFYFCMQCYANAAYSAFNRLASLSKSTRN